MSLTRRHEGTTGSAHPRPIAHSAGSNPPFKIQNSKSAFSLLEVLVSVALLALLSVLLFNMVDQASRLWRDNESAVEAYREARAALTIMSREVQTTLIHSGTAALQGVVLTKIDSGSLPASTSGTASALFYLGLFSKTAQESTDLSDACATGYYVAYTKDPQFSDADSQQSKLNASRKLYRFFTGSNATYSRIRAVLGGTAWNDASNGLYIPSPSSTTTNEMLARNISKLEVSALVLENGKLVRKDNYLTTTHGWPAALDISLTALNTAAAARLPNDAAWNNPPPAETRTFKSRIYLSVQP